MKKKLLCLCLALSVVLTLGTTAFAEDNRKLIDTMLKTPPQEYNNDLALTGLDLSDITYNGEAFVRNYLTSNFGFEDKNIYTKNFDSSLAFAVAVKDYEDCSLLLIAARGTQTEYELKMDASSDAKGSYKDYPVYDFINDFRSEIFGGLEKIVDKDKNYKVFICGHSLGGAAVNLTAAQLIDGFENTVNTSKDDVYCYTFGAIDSIKSEAPVTEGYENIHNIYNDFDTFAPSQYGFLLSNGAGSKVGKFGIIHDFSYDFRNEEQKAKGDIDQILECVNHSLDSYSTALRRGMVPGVLPSDWARAEIEKAVAAGFVPEDLLQNPKAAITREAFAHLAVNFVSYNLGYGSDGILGLNSDAGLKTDEVLFDDTDNPYVLLAARIGIVEGMGDNRFAPGDTITREQAATMLFRTYMAYSTGASMTEPEFTDKESISGWALDAVRFCANYGVMNGYDTGEFAPGDNYTVEQSIATFVRMGEIEEWKAGNFSARFVRKMTKEETIAEYEKMDWQQILERFETPAGTVLYTVTVGVPHAGSHALILVRSSGRAVSLLKNVPKADGWGKTAELEDIKYNEDDNSITFKMTFTEKLEGGASGQEVLHDAGTYFFRVELGENNCTLEKFEPLN